MSLDKSNVRRTYTALSNTSARGLLVKRGESVELTDDEAAVRPVELKKTRTRKAKT